MFDPSTIEAAGSAVVVLAAIAAFFKWIRPLFRMFGSDMRKIRDTLVGREAVTDSITGKELAPAIPSVGERVATIEIALTQIVDTHRRLDGIEERMNTVERAVGIERGLARIESVQLLSTMEAAINAEPEKDKGDDKRDGQK